MLTIEEIRKIREMSSEGYSVNEIFMEVGTSRGSIRKYVSMRGETIEQLYVEMGKSRSEKEREGIKRRSKLMVNRAFSRMMHERTDTLCISSTRIAKFCEVSNEAVSKWRYGIYLPEAERMEKLFQVLEVPYKTHTDVLRDYGEGCGGLGLEGIDGVG